MRSEIAHVVKCSQLIHDVHLSPICLYDPFLPLFDRLTTFQTRIVAGQRWPRTSEHGLEL